MKPKFNGFLVLLLVLFAQLTFAQERAVSGTVTDEAGMPLPGVSVLIKGTKTGTQTDFDGKITLSNVAFASIKSAIGVQVFPNPIVEKRGQIRLSLPTAAHLSGDLFDVNGRLVRRVFDNNFAEGVNEIPLETDAATGIYFLDIRKNGQVVAHKKVFINH